MSTTDDKTGPFGSRRGISVAEKTDVGRTRTENQDSLGSDVFGRYRLWVVCDGMGGHAGGSTASRLGVDTVLEVFGAGDDDDDTDTRLKRAIEVANKRIFQAAKADRDLKGMGTTVAALAIDTEAMEARVAHVGDSRIYLARGDVFRRLTRDHTMVQQMVDDGILTDEQAHDHPHGNVISRSLGGGRSVEVDCLDEPLALEDGDIFLLCSDGLSTYVAEQAIGETLWGNKPKAAAAALVAQANAAGGEDNVTVQIVRFGAQPDAPESFQIVHPEHKPSGLLDELRERAEAIRKELPPARPTNEAPPSEAKGEVAREAADEDADELPPWPEDPSHPELASPMLPALILGVFIGIVSFLGVYLAVEQVTPPPAEEHESLEEAPSAPAEAPVEEDEGAPY